MCIMVYKVKSKVFLVSMFDIRVQRVSNRANVEDVIGVRRILAE